MPAVLNLSNEVVKLRAEVKRVKVLLIRKLIRQMSILEKKKGTEVDLERHRRRAERLREEIHELKVIAPDKVTKAALQTEISFEKVCQNKEASLSERAIARIATHPQFSKRIQSLKEAIKAFKVERISARKAEKQAKNDAEDITLQDQPQEGSGDDDDEDSEKLDNNADEELKEEDGDKMIDKLQEVTCGSSQVSQETSLETSNEQTSQCLKTQMSTTQDSADPVSVPEEVVRMRKEVKRTRVLVISKLTQQVAAFKMKKVEESEVKKNQELAAQLMKDIQALRNLKPDQLTALQENIELEKVLLDPLKSPTDRAIARIVTHTRFINKLQKVREAIEKERAKAAEAEQKKTDRQAVVQSKNAGEEVEDDGDDDEEKKKKEEEEEEEEKEEEDDDDEDEEEDNKEEENDDEEEKEEEDDDDKEEEDGEEKYDSKDNKNEVGNEKTDRPFIEIHKSVEPTEKTDPDAVKMPTIKAITTPPEKSRGPEVKSQIAEATALKTSPKKSSTVSSTESKLPKNIKITEKEIKNIIKPEKKQDLPETSQPQSQKDDEESDLSDDDHEEKEYFDDSTEERFHKQSSYSEESDNDDFFLGKVTKFKKRKSGQAKAERTKSETQTQNVEKSTSKPPETNLGKLQSVFCSTLSKSSISQKPTHGFGHDGPRSSRFQKGPEGRMKPSLYRDSGTDRRAVPFKPNKQTFTFAGQRQGGPPGAGRGRSQFEQHQNQNARGPSAKMSNPPQQSLHPSWEASKKRKEQQAQITGFQGKKIKFDDDD